MTIELHDCRNNEQQAYDTKIRLGRMKASWHLGVKQAHDGSQAVTFQDGLTWGSIGQILGYLLGEVDEEMQEELYNTMYDQLCASDHGKGLQPKDD